MSGCNAGYKNYRARKLKLSQLTRFKNSRVRRLTQTCQIRVNFMTREWCINIGSSEAQIITVQTTMIARSVFLLFLFMIQSLLQITCDICALFTDWEQTNNCEIFKGTYKAPRCDNEIDRSLEKQGIFLYRYSTAQPESK